MDWSEYLRFLLALVFVIAIIALLAWLARRAGFGGAAMARRNRGQQRLAIEEVLVLDPRRRLALVRRDNVEHLLLLSADGDRVIETAIAPAPGRTAPPATPT